VVVVPAEAASVADPGFDRSVDSLLEVGAAGFIAPMSVEVREVTAAASPPTGVLQAARPTRAAVRPTARARRRAGDGLTGISSRQLGWHEV